MVNSAIKVLIAKNDKEDIKEEVEEVIEMDMEEDMEDIEKLNVIIVENMVIKVLSVINQLVKIVINAGNPVI